MKLYERILDFDWESNTSGCFLNPRLPKQEFDFIKKNLGKLDSFDAKIWIASSGSSSNKIRLLALSKDALFASAKAVNRHLESDALDRWLAALPIFHVGGLGIWARAFLSGAKVFPFYDAVSKWDPTLCLKRLTEEKITLTSLVPTQIFDLVSAGLKSPKTLRAVLVGGAALSPALYTEARRLGWPLLPSYGLSECASQVATATLRSLQDAAEIFPKLELLPHLLVKTVYENRLAFKGESLFDRYAWIGDTVDFEDPKKDGWFISEDRGEVETSLDDKKTFLKCLGRITQVVKIRGELVDWQAIDIALQSFLAPLKLDFKTAVVAVEDPRLGHRLVLVAESKGQSKERFDLLEKSIESFNETLPPFSKIEHIFWIEAWPQTALGKLKIEEAKQWILKQGEIK